MLDEIGNLQKIAPAKRSGGRSLVIILLVVFIGLGALVAVPVGGAMIWLYMSKKDAVHQAHDHYQSEVQQAEDLIDQKQKEGVQDGEITDDAGITEESPTEN